MRYMLTFYAVEDEWMALPEAERNAGIAEIAQWFAEHARAGKIVEGQRLGRGAKTVRLGRVRKKDLPMLTDGPFIEAKESVGSYAVVEVEKSLSPSSAPIVFDLLSALSASAARPSARRMCARRRSARASEGRASIRSNSSIAASRSASAAA